MLRLSVLAAVLVPSPHQYSYYSPTQFLLHHHHHHHHHLLPIQYPLPDNSYHLIPPLLFLFLLFLPY
ncbi:hypothetical protein RIF29_07488 [Crotalaria pallida]|uniref:Uncharacterized protein n=1 Tax=Crotalaria pallida TaxID=3830 RepID=A0AAN9J525_CROPI